MYQRTIIVGNCGSSPEMRYTPSGVAVTNFSVAVNKRWKDANGEQQERVTWFRVNAWRRLAEVCNEYITKGKLVMCEGEVEARAFTGNDGNPRASLSLTARNVTFLGGRSDSETGHTDPYAVADRSDEHTPFAEDKDVPF